jgi:hypothetical protein
MVTVDRRVEQALVAIDERWDLWPTMPERIVKVLGQTLQGSSVAMHHWQGADVAFDAHTFDRNPSELAWVTQGAVLDARLYDPKAPGADADRVVDGEELRHRSRRKWSMFEDGFLNPMHLGDQVRSLITDDDGRLLAFVGAFAPRGRRAAQADIEVFKRLLHPISERIRCWKLLTQGSVEKAAIFELVTQMSKPAFIVSAEGALLFANRTAQLMIDWSGDNLEGACRQSPAPTWVRKIPVTQGHRQLYVCFPHDAEVNLERLGRWAAQEWNLPVRLHTSAAKVIAGRTDKEIARETNLSHATVRTYIQQVYRHVGVSSRTALMREALRVLYR